MQTSTLDTVPTTPPRWRRLNAFAANPSAMVAGLFLTIVGVLALAAPLLYPGDPLAIVGKPFLWPGDVAAHPLGTDALGRDVLAGILHGARVSLAVGIAATAGGLLLGIVVGATAGYFGGTWDDICVRVIEVFQTVPNFVLLVVVVAIVEPSVTTVIVAIALIMWPTVARLTRAEFRSIREKDYVMAARSLGCGSGWIIFREILPNALPPIVVTSSVMVASAILMESGLSFMGLGDPNAISWGAMIGAGRELIRTAWYLTAIPGTAIVLTVLALNLVGEGLNDALNPRLIGRR